VHVCDALRASVAQRSYKLFLMPLPSAPRGRTGRRKTQKSKFAKIEFSKLQNCKIKKLENIHREFVFAEIHPEIVCRKIVF
jgi:hypothetical protein